MSEFADPQKPYYLCDKFLDFLHRTEIIAILAYFCLNLVAMATPLAPLKIEVAYLNSPTLYTTVYVRKIPAFFAQY